MNLISFVSEFIESKLNKPPDHLSMSGGISFRDFARNNLSGFKFGNVKGLSSLTARGQYFHSNHEIRFSGSLFPFTKGIDSLDNIFSIIDNSRNSSGLNRSLVNRFINTSKHEVGHFIGDTFNKEAKVRNITKLNMMRFGNRELNDSLLSELEANVSTVMFDSHFKDTKTLVNKSMETFKGFVKNSGGSYGFKSSLFDRSDVVSVLEDHIISTKNVIESLHNGNSSPRVGGIVSSSAIRNDIARASNTVKKGFGIKSLVKRFIK